MHGQRTSRAERRQRAIEEYRAEWPSRGVEHGRCLCGCGAATDVWTESDFRAGRIQGEHRKWVRNHHLLLSPVEYVQEDRGHATACWVWQRSYKANGYGQGPSAQLAHRVIWERHRGPIPDGLHLDHLCRVRACVNPDHLEPVTQRENNRRQSNRRLSMDEARWLRIAFGLWAGSKWAFCRLHAPTFGVHPGSIDYVLANKTWREED